MHNSSLDRMQEFRNKYLSGRDDCHLTIMDLGSMNVNGTYRDIFDNPNWKYVGLDMDEGNGVDLVLKNPYIWKEIRSDSVDLLISGQAFEHIEFFWITILEIYRVLKPGGLCCIIAPSGGFEHKYPVDCWRFYPDGFKALANYAQLDVLDVSTQWENRGYEDGSDDWHDSVLVCRKPSMKGWLKIKNEILTRIRHRVLTTYFLKK